MPMTKIYMMDDQTRKNFANRLRHLRALRYETAEEFAKILGIDGARYRKWEQAKAEPSLAWLMRVCQMLGCTPDFLLIGFNTPPNNLPLAKPEKMPQVKRPKQQQKRNA